MFSVGETKGMRERGQESHYKSVCVCACVCVCVCVLHRHFV